MKKLILFIMWCVPAALVAQTQNGVTVSGLEINSGTVTFNVSWSKPMPVEVWADSAWVFVDYNKNGVMERLPVSGATATAGTVTKISGNDKGVWVAGNARTNDSFSAKVELFTEIKDVAGACAYASNYPPVGEYTGTNTIKFTGTAPYTVMLKDNPDPQTAGSIYTVPGAIESFTDKTGAPGKLGCIPSTVYNLLASAAGYCEDVAGVTFSLSGTENGRIYQLYKGSAVDATLTGNGSAMSFDGLHAEGNYTAKVLASANGHCEAAMNESYTISKNLLPKQPTIAKPDDVCLNGGNIVFTATDYSGSLTWVSNGGGVVNGNSVTFASAAIGTKTVTARTAQTYTNALTCYSAEVTQSAVVNALPTVTSSTGAARCGEGTVVLTATTSADAMIDWYTQVSGGTSVTTGNNYTTPSISTSTTYYVQARAATGCVSAARTAVLATVNAIPTAPTGLSSNVTTICNGTATAATLTANGANVGSGAVYEWGTGTVGNGSPATTTGNTYSVNPSAATTYWVRLKGNTGACSTTVTGGATTSIAATTPPMAPTSLSPDISTICNGTSTTITLTASAANAGSAVYEWGTGSTPGDYPLTPSTTTESSRTVTLSLATNYWVRLRGTGACSATITPGTTTSVTVFEPPTAPANLSSNVTSICTGTTTSATLTANGATVGSGAVYEWGTGTVGNGSPATTTGNTYSVNPSVATTYWVRLKGNTGACSATVTDGATTSIAATTPPMAPTSLSPDISTICNGTSTTITLAASAANAGSAVYEWGTGSTPGDYPLTPSTTTESSRTVTLSLATNYWVRLRGTGACSATITNGTTTSVAVSEPPTAPASLLSNVTSICAGVSTPATLTANGATVGSGAVYEWGRGAVGENLLTPATTTESSRTITLSAATIYWVRLKGATGACSATVTAGVTASITANAAPAAPTNVTATSRCGPGEVTFSATPPAGGCCTIDWYSAYGGGDRLASNAPSYSPTLTETKAYYAESRNTETGCVNSARVNVTATLYPEPTITLSGGNASQTVTQGTAITAMTYTASATATISLTSGGFPNDVTGAVSGSSFTISGTPSSTGTFGYSLIATTANNCTSGASVGTITVNAAGQPQGSCTYTPPAEIGTFASFDAGAATYVSLRDERDNKIYPVVKIGGRWIMARNLNYQKDLYFNANSNQANGSEFTTSGAGTYAIGSFWCPGGVGGSSVMSSTLASCDVWGALYTWETAMMVDGKWSDDSHSSTAWGSDPATSTSTGVGNTNNGCRGADNTNGHGICPAGWHVPTDKEWGDILNAMESGSGTTHNNGTSWRGSVAGAKSKSKCMCSYSSSRCATDEDVRWQYSSTVPDQGTDAYGFRVLPSGYRHGDGSKYTDRGNFTIIWSSSAYSGTIAWTRGFSYGYPEVSRSTFYSRSYGLSVRCIRDL